MQYMRLGKSDLTISSIGLGCMSLPANDESLSMQIIHRAFELGINYFDTADLYDKGKNESIVGKALKGKRDKIVLATKVGNQWKADGSGWDWNPRKGYILKTVEESLRRLQTDYIDLYQLHGGAIDDPIEETIGTFELLQQQGKIRFYGISSIRPNLVREYVRRSKMVSVMMQYSLADRRPEEEMLGLLQENNIGVLVRGALAQGMLVNKPAKDYLGQNTDEMAHVAEVIRSLSNEKRTAAQIAIRYVLQHDAVTAVVIGMSRLEQLEEIAETSDLEPLTETELRLLESSISAIKYEQHR